MIMILDDKGIVTYESPSWAKTMGYEEGHFIGQQPFAFIHPEDLNGTMKDFGDALKGSIDGFRRLSASGRRMAAGP